MAHLYLNLTGLSRLVADSAVAPALHKVPGTCILREFDVGCERVLLGDCEVRTRLRRTRRAP